MAGLETKRRRTSGDNGGGGGGSGGGGSGVNGDGGTAGEAHAATARQQVPRAPRLRSVLVVDDEEFIRTLTQLALEGQCEGCVVETAANGALADRTLGRGTLSLAPRRSPRLSRSVHPDPGADAGAGAGQARRVSRFSSSGAGWQTPPWPVARATSPRSTTSCSWTCRCPSSAVRPTQRPTQRHSQRHTQRHALPVLGGGAH